MLFVSVFNYTAHLKKTKTKKNNRSVPHVISSENRLMNESKILHSI